MQGEQETHNSAQDDLDAGHGGSVEVEEVYCAMIVRLALRYDMRTAVCKEGTERETASTQMHRAGSRACPDTPPAKLSPRVGCFSCPFLRRSSNNPGASGSRGVPVHCMRGSRVIRGSTATKGLCSLRTNIVRRHASLTKTDCIP